MTQFGGMRKNGFIGYWKGLVPHGIPVWLLPLMIPVEILGLLTKPFALAVRLFANMIAGHTVILALIGLIFFMNTIICCSGFNWICIFYLLAGDFSSINSGIYIYNAVVIIYRDGSSSGTLRKVFNI